MLSTAIIIFRETVEIALILGVILAATRELVGRMKWIIGGFAGGAAGAALVAVFAEVISASAAGMGQEFFNALILFTAAIVIGWTVLWMHSHARQMTAHLKTVGQQVADGNIPLYSLALVIALAMLREGSETVLFIYGMTLSGQSTGSIVIGSSIGVSGGIVVGVMLYYGLLKLSTRYMFRVTTWLLMLLVAGLSAQGVGFLSAAGYFSTLSQAVWDSSWLLADDSIAGKALHSLIGYTAHPSEIQLLFYGASLMLMIALLNITSHKRTVAAVAIALLTAATLAPHPALALDKIYSPNVVKGELELEYAASRAFDGDSSKNNAQAHEFEAEYGLTDRMVPEIAGTFVKEPDGDIKMDATEIGSRFQFFEQDENWIDSGLLLTYAKAVHHTNADAIEAKLLLEKQTGDFIHRANIGVERQVGSHAQVGVDTSFAMNSRYRYSPHFEPGIELQSSFGNSSDHLSFNNQEHYFGPVVYGSITQRLKYEAAYLFGISNAAASGAGRIALEYEFHI